MRKVIIDKEKVKSILRICNERIKEVEKKELTNNNPPIIAENYYEIIKELLICLALLHGFKSENHECLVSSLKNTINNMISRLS